MRQSLPNIVNSDETDVGLCVGDDSGVSAKLLILWWTR
jgi:hypothetical protein